MNYRPSDLNGLLYFVLALNYLIICLLLMLDKYSIGSHFTSMLLIWVPIKHNSPAVFTGKDKRKKTRLSRVASKYATGGFKAMQMHTSVHLTDVIGSKRIVLWCR